MDDHLAPRERLIAAEAKLVGSLAVLVWLLPLIFVLELVLAANGLIADVSFGYPVASVLETLIWVLGLMFVVRMIERQIDSGRKLKREAIHNGGEAAARDG